jgi:hypothetical protein
MEEVLCGVLTKKDQPCKYPAHKCPHHQHRQAAKQGLQAAVRPVVSRSQPDFEPPSPPVQEPPALAEHDLRELGWWVIAQVLGESLDPRSAAVVVTVMRVLTALGAEPMAEEEALKETALRGRIMNGQAPRDAEEWERAARIFDADALAEFRRWERGPLALDGALLEGDGGDGGEPLIPGDRTAHE